ncbi:glycosyltransferase [Myxococcota bacterium]|nr:glycosyltransferase [Myxococcota bacterium]MBU1537795.1 glycosyltransferase [Myxococcota bacterium]
MPERVKVLFYAPGFLFGGIESLMIGWCENFDSKRVRFDLLREQREETDAVKRLKALGGNVYSLPHFRSLPSYFKELTAFFRDHNDYDVLHAQTPNLFVFFLARMHGIRNIVIHSHTTRYNRYNISSAIKTVLNWNAKKLVTDRLACSHTAGQWMYGKNKEFTIVNNSIDTVNYLFNSDVRDTTRAALGLSENLVIGNVSRFSIPKNHLFLLEIFNEILKINPKSKLLLVGDGELRPMIEKKIADLGLGDSVILTGVRDDIPDLLQAMDLFLLPSIFEGFPVTIVEAQASSLPCVLSDAVTEETRFTDLVSFISLERPAKFWAEQVLERAAKTERTNRYEDVVKAGYDMKTTAKWLEDYYFRLAKK